MANVVTRDAAFFFTISVAIFLINIATLIVKKKAAYLLKTT